MKLNWFSPLPPARTEIANHTLRTLPALCSLADVTLWTEQKAWDPQLGKFAEIRSFKPGRLPWDDLNRADISIYNLGNNPLFHVGAWQTSRQHPGVVVLHDFRMYHFFDDIYRVRLNREAYLAVMERYYGRKVVRMELIATVRMPRNSIHGGALPAYVSGGRKGSGRNGSQRKLL